MLLLYNGTGATRSFKGLPVQFTSTELAIGSVCGIFVLRVQFVYQLHARFLALTERI